MPRPKGISKDKHRENLSAPPLESGRFDWTRWSQKRGSFAGVRFIGTKEYSSEAPVIEPDDPLVKEWNGRVYGGSGDGVRKRKKPSSRVRARILAKQEGFCAYCGYRFGEIVLYRGRERALMVTFDHFVPTQSNPDSENGWIAACQFCQSLKSNIMFDSFEKAKGYIQDRLKTQLTRRRSRKTEEEE